MPYWMEKKPPLPAGYADDPDFLLLIGKLGHIEAFVSEAKKRIPATSVIWMG